MLSSSLIALLSSVAVCSLLLLLQAERNTHLKDQIEAARQGIQEIKPRLAAVRVPTSDSAPRGNLTAGEVDKADLEKSKEQVSKSLRIINEALADIDHPQGLIQGIPAILQAVQYLTLEELIQVADGIGAISDPSAGDIGMLMRTMLYSLAAEHDQARILGRDDLMSDSALGSSILLSIARSDPEAAIRILQQVEWSGVVKPMIRGSILFRILRQDVQKGLSLLRKVKEDGDAFEYNYASLPLRPETLPELAVALRKNQDLRVEITRMIISSATHHSGVAGMRAIVSQFDMDAGAVAEVLQDNLNDYLAADQHSEMMLWLSEPTSPPDLQELIPTVTESWAKADYNAAGGWLSLMEPSVHKDDAISSFSKVVTDIDPRAATIWADQIQDEETRLNAIRPAVQHWKKDDPDAAQDWIEDNGFDPAEF